MQPKGVLYFGMELDQIWTPGLIGRGLVRTGLYLVRRLVGQFHASLGDTHTGEVPHLVFPLKAVEYFRVTPARETPPSLGKPLKECVPDIF